MSMHHYAVYETETGKVLSAGKGSNPAIIDLTRENLAGGQSLFEGEIDPATTYLPGGVPAPKPAEVRTVTPQEVKAHAGRLLRYTDWVIVKAFDTGEAADPEIVANRQAIRDASNRLEAISPIPADFTDPKYWP